MKVSTVLCTTALLMIVGQAKISNASYFYNKERPIILAHRGACGQFPEHSLGAYTSAYMYGADFVELDLQVTKDGHIIVNHDPTLKETTDIDDYYSVWGDRRHTLLTFPPYLNTYLNDYLINEFTLEELKVLRRKMR